MFLDALDYKKSDVSVIYWDRDTKEDIKLLSCIKTYRYAVPMEDEWSILKKSKRILGYSRFANRIIEQIKPDYLIILYSTTALTVWKQLFGNYKGKYIFDYRDLTYEKRLTFYSDFVKKVAINSEITFTSSDGFRRFLPSIDKVKTSHNVPSNAMDIMRENKPRIMKGKKIVLAFWGLIRDYEITECIIDKLCNDCRYELHYYGRAQGKMLELMEKKDLKYSSFHFHGEYHPEERMLFSQNIDILLNIYDDSGTMKYAMGNKYYDGLMFYLPQLCMENTFMGDRVQEKKVGLACNPFKDGFEDSIVEYYTSLDNETFSMACKTELETIMDEVSKNNNILQKILNR